IAAGWGDQVRRGRRKTGRLPATQLFRLPAQSAILLRNKPPAIGAADQPAGGGLAHLSHGISLTAVSDVLMIDSWTWSSPQTNAAFCGRWMHSWRRTAIRG